MELKQKRKNFYSPKDQPISRFLQFPQACHIEKSSQKQYLEPETPRTNKFQNMALTQLVRKVKSSQKEHPRSVVPLVAFIVLDCLKDTHYYATKPNQT